jgi:hypothetical protein
MFTPSLLNLRKAPPIIVDKQRDVAKPSTPIIELLDEIAALKDRTIYRLAKISER